MPSSLLINNEITPKTLNHYLSSIASNLSARRNKSGWERHYMITKRYQAN